MRLDALHRQLRLLGDNNPVSKLQVKLEPGDTLTLTLTHTHKHTHMHTYLTFDLLCASRCEPQLSDEPVHL